MSGRHAFKEICYANLTRCRSVMLWLMTVLMLSSCSASRALTDDSTLTLMAFNQGAGYKSVNIQLGELFAAEPDIDEQIITIAPSAYAGNLKFLVNQTEAVVV